MIGDLIKIFETVQSAQTEQERKDLERQLVSAAQAEIRVLFDDPKYPRRRRTFGAIRQRLAIFDNDPDKLTQILFLMNARRLRGDGDDALWELPNAQTPDSPRNPMRWQTVALLIGACALVIVGFLNFSTLRGLFLE